MADEQDPTVSIVMPTYRQAAFLPDALEGLANQTFKDFELIVVQDGPDPETHIVLKQSEYMRGKKWYTRKENGGTAEALNQGFEYARGKYWTWVSSDNVMHWDWLKTLVHVLDEMPYDVIYTGYIRDTGRMAADGWASNGGCKPTVFQHPYEPLINSENCFIGPSFLYRCELHEKVGPHRGAISHDYDWWLRAEEHGTIGWWEDCLATYRVHGGRVTVTKKKTYDANKWRKAALARRAAAAESTVGVYRDADVQPE